MLSLTFYRRVAAGVIVGTLGAGTALAQNSGADGYRCVIEPALIVKVGSPTVGLLDEVSVDRGSIVRRGDVLARLRSDVERTTFALAKARAEGRAEIEASRARLTLSRKKLDRAEALFARQVATAETVDELRAEAQVNEQTVRQAELTNRLAQLEAERAKVLLDERTIVSTVNGVVMRRVLSAGEYVHSEAHIVELAQLDTLHVEAFLPSNLYGRIGRGMSAKVTPQDPIGGTYEAKVAIVDRVLDAASGTFGVRLVLANPDLALPGGIHCRVRFLDLAATPDAGPGSAERADARSRRGGSGRN